MSPVHAHLPEGLPECGVGEGLDAGDEPDLVEDAQHTLTQLITHVICTEEKHVISEQQKISHISTGSMGYRTFRVVSKNQQYLPSHGTRTYSTPFKYFSSRKLFKGTGS